MATISQNRRRLQDRKKEYLLQPISDTVVVSSIYSEFWGTKEFRKSVKKVRLPLHNAFPGGPFTGNGDVMAYLYDAYESLKDKYKYAIYSDGADTLFIRSFQPPNDHILFSTEKAMWPPIPDISGQYPPCETPWKYLNAGNVCGPTYLMAEFYKRYGLDQYRGKDVNGQLQLAQAYLKAIKEEFPVKLDTNCEYFQTVAFSEEGELAIVGGMSIEGVSALTILNTITGTNPNVLHGNGRTDMSQYYKIFK